MTAPRPHRGKVVAWALYDFANSAFATTILAVIFNQYYATVVAGGDEGTRILGPARARGDDFDIFADGVRVGRLVVPPLRALYCRPG